jgi:hypothetical protein
MRLIWWPFDVLNIGDFNLIGLSDFIFHFPDLHGSKLSRGMQRSLPQKLPPN